MQLEAFSYRTSSRFGSVVKIEIMEKNTDESSKEKTIVITGPRIGKGIYWTWIAVQIILMAAFIPALIIPIVFGIYYLLFLIVALFFIHLAVGGLGAGAMWEAARLADFDENKEESTVSFRKNDIKNIKIGKGWARGLIWLAIPYYIPLVDISSKDYCISFEAPGSGSEKNLSYALLMRTKKDTQDFLKLIS